MQAVLVLFILSVLVDGNYCSGYLNHGRRSCIRIVVVPFVSAILTSMHLLRAMLTLIRTHTPRYIYIYIYIYIYTHTQTYTHTHIQSSTIHPYVTCPYAHIIVIYSRTCVNRILLLCSLLDYSPIPVLVPVPCHTIITKMCVRNAQIAGMTFLSFSFSVLFISSTSSLGK